LRTFIAVLNLSQFLSFVITVDLFDVVVCCACMVADCLRVIMFMLFVHLKNHFKSCHHLMPAADLKERLSLAVKLFTRYAASWN